MPSRTEVEAAVPLRRGTAADLAAGDIVEEVKLLRRLRAGEQELKLPLAITSIKDLGEGRYRVAFSGGKSRTFKPADTFCGYDAELRFRRPSDQFKRSYIPHVILTVEDLNAVVDDYLEGDYFVFDCETVGTRPSRGGPKDADIPALDERTNKVIWIALAAPGRVDVIPIEHPGGPELLPPDEIFSSLKRLFFSDLLKVNHNVKFDILSLAKYFGAIPPGPYADTGTLVHLLNDNLHSYRLGDLVQHYFGFEYRKMGREGAMDEFPFWDVARYVGLDAKLAQLLWEYMRPRLARLEKVERIFDLEGDITEVLLYAKRRGALVDSRAFAQLDAHLAGELAQLEERIYDVAGRRFLITSTQQRADLLYGDKEDGGLELECKVFTKKGGDSTSEAALAPLVRKHPVVPLLMRHADLSKLKSTYTSGFAPHIEDDQRIRSSFNQSGTVTGRFSSSGPNLQNIPRQSDDSEAERIRSMFVAPPGYVLVVGDFSQIEYRIMAHYAGPLVKRSRLLEAFNDGIDLHAMTAAGLYMKDPSEVGTEERQAGKTANFLLMFGGRENRLIQSGLARTEKQAEQIYKGFHGTYPEVDRFTEKTVAECRRMQKPFVETLWGRRRRLPKINIPRINKEAGRIRAYNERQAVNHKIQGTAADLNKAAMVRAFRRLDRYGLKEKSALILTVHDEIILEVPEDKAEAGVSLLTEAMEGVKVKLRVPLVADVHFGRNWADAKS